MKDILDLLLADGVIDEVLGRLKSGKEANISLVRRGDAVIAAKVYKDRATRSFKNNADYKEGRAVRNTRTARAMAGGGNFGRDAAEEAWKSAEADALFKLHGTGVRVPAPILFYEGVLLMELVHDADGRPAPRLIDIAVPRDDAMSVYADLAHQIITMLCNDLIHGDLSPYNILASADGPTIIDFPQVISAAHSSRAEFFFLRDYDNVVRFLAGFDPSLAIHRADGRAIWQAYVRRELTPQYVPPPPRDDRPSARRTGPAPRDTRPPRDGRPPPRDVRPPPRDRHPVVTDRHPVSADRHPVPASPPAAERTPEPPGWAAPPRDDGPTPLHLRVARPARRDEGPALGSYVPGPPRDDRPPPRDNRAGRRSAAFSSGPSRDGRAPQQPRDARPPHQSQPRDARGPQQPPPRDARGPAPSREARGPQQQPYPRDARPPLPQQRDTRDGRPPPRRASWAQQPPAPASETARPATPAAPRDTRPPPPRDPRPPMPQPAWSAPRPAGNGPPKPQGGRRRPKRRF